MRTEVPVSKYRSVEQMPPTPRVSDDELVERITALWSRARRYAPLSIVPGVQRFRSVEEASAARREATAERMRKARKAPAD
jgi:hypothetical protein